MDKLFKYKEQYQDCRFYYISRDEVYGTLKETDLFEEKTLYAPYSALKASSNMIVIVI